MTLLFLFGCAPEPGVWPPFHYTVQGLAFGLMIGFTAGIGLCLRIYGRP